MELGFFTLHIDKWHQWIISISKEIDEVNELTLSKDLEHVISESPFLRKSMIYRGIGKEKFWVQAQVDIHHEIPFLTPIIGKYASTLVLNRDLDNIYKKYGFRLKYVGTGARLIVLEF